VVQPRRVRKGLQGAHYACPPGAGALRTELGPAQPLDRFERRGPDITVNAVAPGSNVQAVPTPVADLVAFLVSGDGHGRSGRVIAVDNWYG
jgi:hypothetical protein